MRPCESLVLMLCVALTLSGCGTRETPTVPAKAEAGERPSLGRVGEGHKSRRTSSAVPAPGHLPAAATSTAPEDAQSRSPQETGDSVVAATAVTDAKSVAPLDAVFEKIPSAPVTNQTLSEDGRYLYLAHEPEGAISVWDCDTERIVHSVKTTAPRFILSRGPLVIVANYGAGQISVFDSKDGWKLVRNIPLGHSGVYYLSAPGGEFFSGQLLATCEEGEPGSPGRKFVSVNVQSGTRELIRSDTYVSAATVDYAGRAVIYQAMITHSPSATVKGTIPFSAEPQQGAALAGSGEHADTPLLAQARGGDYWVGGNRVYAGLPPKPAGPSRGQLLIRDSTLPVVYQFEPATVTCLVLSDDFPAAGSRRAQYPPALERMSPNRHPAAKEHGDSLLFQHAATTVNGVTSFYIFDRSSSAVYHARITAFELPEPMLAKGRAAETLRPDVPAAAAGPSVGVGAPVLAPETEVPGWRLVTSQEGRFRIELPGPPLKTQVQVDAENAVLGGQGLVVELADQAGACLVQWADYDERSKRVRPDVILEGAMGGMTEGALEKEISVRRLGKYPGRELRYELERNGKRLYFEGRLYLVGNRLYQIGVMGTGKPLPRGDVERFFKSFALVPR